MIGKLIDIAGGLFMLLKDKILLSFKKNERTAKKQNTSKNIDNWRAYLRWRL